VALFVYGFRVTGFEPPKEVVGRAICVGGVTDE